MASRFQPRRATFTQGRLIGDRFASSPGRTHPRPVQAPPPVRPPPPAALVDAVLRYHDVELDQGGERTLLRLSERRMREPEVASALGADASRAARVAILWNERESEIIRVLEAA
ncbi:MAG: hypothetical protein JNK30_15545 [Phenylobacterium sp.]|uniref:hypothetical protein n=1 Tax=Phenylobacterium sp. TaxID=1871053 RepID=UPI001A390BAC|nr:hypothetical protein [Phenylobacterium sp.]MBL8772796.1 hypothetical protein [Phenylobacterium sp.]